MKLKVMLIACIISVGFIGSSTFAAVGSVNINKRLVKTYQDSHGNKYDIYRIPAITVITPKQYSLQFVPQGARLIDVVRNNNCMAGLNGTYFGYNNDGTYFPAGVWYEYGSFVREPYQPAVDKNLRVLLSGDGTTIDMIDNDSFNFKTLLTQTQSASRYVNAGPWLVRDGKINAAVLDKTSHWQRGAYRVGVIKNEDNSVHFVVSTQPISLPQFISFAYASGFGKGSFQFVNLDGGSSASLYTPYNNYQPRKRLPSFICIL